MSQMESQLESQSPLLVTIYLNNFERMKRSYVIDILYKNLKEEIDFVVVAFDLINELDILISAKPDVSLTSFEMLIEICY